MRLYVMLFLLFTGCSDTRFVAEVPEGDWAYDGSPTTLYGLDLGTVAPNKEIVVSRTIHNLSDSELIQPTKFSGCDCVTFQLSPPVIQPGERGQVSVTCSSPSMVGPLSVKRSGLIAKHGTVLSIQVHGEVTGFGNATHTSAQDEVRLDENLEAFFVLPTNSLSPNWAVELHRSSIPPWLSVTATVRGEKQGVLFKATDAAWEYAGEAFARVAIASEESGHMVLPLRVLVPHAVEFSVPHVTFDAHSGQEHTFTVTSRALRFSDDVAVITKSEGFESEVVESDSKQLVVRVRCLDVRTFSVTELVVKNDGIAIGMLPLIVAGKR